MKRNVLLDTGPLIAYLDRRDKFHEWSRDLWKDIEPPLLTCEAVISEACFLLSSIRDGVQGVFELLQRQILTVSFRLTDETVSTASLLKKYADLPMSVADACLVRMAEQYHGSTIFTVDSDFRIYRKQGRQVIPLISPKGI